MVAAAETDALAQSTPDSAGADGVKERYGEDVAIRDFDGDPARLTENGLRLSPIFSRSER